MSRLLFAIDDLAVELERLGLDDSGARIVLTRPLYDAAKAEIGHHYGRPPVEDAALGGVAVGRVVLCHK